MRVAVKVTLPTSLIAATEGQEINCVDRCMLPHSVVRRIHCVANALAESREQLEVLNL